MNKALNFLFQRAEQTFLPVRIGFMKSNTTATRMGAV
jgi:hypothetical protein